MKYEDFEKQLEEDLAWRKKEIASLIILASDKNEVILKSCILLLYAHWEGYIKKSCKLYLKYVSETKTKFNELNNNFKAIFLKDLVSQCSKENESLSVNLEILLMKKIEKLESKTFSIKINLDEEQDKSYIDTEANLTPKVLKKLSNIIGILYKESIKNQEEILNNHLLHNRHCIGHGGKIQNSDNFSLSQENIDILRQIILEIIDDFKNTLLAYAENEFYLIKNCEKKNEFEINTNKELEKTLSKILQKPRTYLLGKATKFLLQP